MRDWRARDLRGYGRVPPRLEWPKNVRLAISVVINVEEGTENAESEGDSFNEIPVELSGSPRTRGIAGQRDLHSESSFEFGSRAGVWRLLDLVDRLGIPVTWFVSAEALVGHQELASAIRERADEVAGHGLRWGGKRHCDMDCSEERAAIVGATEIIATAVGTRPLGWFTRYGPSSHTRRLLAEEGFVYDSDSFGDDRPYCVLVDGRPFAIVPYSFTYNDNRFVVPQGYSSPSCFVDDVRRAVEFMRAEGERGRVGFLTIGLHPRIAGQAARAHAVEEALAYVRSMSDVWFATRLQLARLALDGQAVGASASEASS